MELIIVSHKRAGRVTTHKGVAGCSVCVPESQASDYRAAHSELPIIAHPDTVVGLPAKRQWILDHYPDVFMLDDDLKGMHRLYQVAGQSSLLSPQLARDIILSSAESARAAGCHLFGFASSKIPATYNGLQPISLSGYLIEGWIGFLGGSKLFYPRDLRLCGDYWISCLNAYYHRKIWRDNRFSFQPTDTFHNPGGQSEFRNLEAEKEAFEFLKRHFGDAIQEKKDTHLVKRKHPYQKSLNLPF